MIITDKIFAEMPFLVATNLLNVAMVNNAKENTFILLQNSLKKDDLQVFDETTYTNQESLLVVYYTSYNLIMQKVLENVGGIAGQTTVGNLFTKKKKADVLELEYDVVKAEYGASLAMKTTDLLDSYKTKLCSVARALNVKLDICNTICTVRTPPKFYPN